MVVLGMIFFFGMELLVKYGWWSVYVFGYFFDFDDEVFCVEIDCICGDWIGRVECIVWNIGCDYDLNWDDVFV